MKALDFLKEQRIRHKNMADSMKVVYFDDELDEAIEELKHLQNRSCNGCIYDGNTIYPDICEECSRNYFDNYIQKDTE